jgi:PAS domain S-box-containing protein
MTLTDHEILSASILIVDDQANNVKLLERLLADAGYTGVSSTMDPQQVCALHRKNDYDLILLDLQLPVMDGFQVMAALQAGAKAMEEAGTHAADYLPVIVLTAQPGHKLRALQAGAKDFISKPFDLVEVRTRIRNMLEVRLLYRRLETHNQELERVVLERTAELRESEARFRSLTELASDWYWEQDVNGRFTRVSGPVLEMLGLRVEALEGSGIDEAAAESEPGWDEDERKTLRACIAARQPFLDFVFTRTLGDGSQRQFRVSGEPIFTTGARFVGYRGIGVEMTLRRPHVT